MVPEVGSDDDDEVTEKGTKLYISNLDYGVSNVEACSELIESKFFRLYEDECEAAINEKINVENNISYVYHSLFTYFDWEDNIILKFFKESSDKEREHAEKLMKYQKCLFRCDKGKGNTSFLVTYPVLAVVCVAEMNDSTVKNLAIMEKKYATLLTYHFPPLESAMGKEEGGAACFEQDTTSLLLV
ncbi:Dysferlin [Orobanche gracilis]